MKMSEIIVTQEALKNLMDNQYKFHSLHSKLEHMSPEVKYQFEELQNYVKELFKPYQEKEDQNLAIKMDLFDKIQEENCFTTTWSIYSVDNLNDIFGYVDSVKYEGCVVVVGKEVTWLELWAVADSLVKQSGDSHHIFIEGFSKRPNLTAHELITGS